LLETLSIVLGSFLLDPEAYPPGSVLRFHLPSHWELSQSSRPLIHLEGVKKRNATSIAFVVDQLSPDTISLSLQDEAHQRLLQQPPVRSFYVLREYL